MKHKKVVTQIRNDSEFEFSVEFEVPQMESIEEVIEFYGGVDEVVSRLNKMTERTAIQYGKMSLMHTKGASLTDLSPEIEHAKLTARTYSPVALHDTTKKKAAALNGALIASLTATQVFDFLVYDYVFTQEDYDTIKKINAYWRSHF